MKCKARLHIRNGKVLEEHVVYSKELGSEKKYLDSQNKIVLKNCGYIDPEKLLGMWKALKGDGIEMAGFMTWSVGWDHQNQWEFAENLGEFMIGHRCES